MVVYARVKKGLEEIVGLRLSPRTLQQSAVLMAAGLSGNVLQYLFHFVSSRMLGPAEYGIFAALLAFSTILLVPAGIAQTVVTQYISGFLARNEMHKISALFSDSLVKFSIASATGFALVVLMSPLFAAFLNLSSMIPVIAMASLLLFAGPFTVIIGSLQGLQRFYIVAAQLFFGPGLRLAAGAGLIAIGWGASGALGATTVSNLIVVILGLLYVRNLWGSRRAEHGLTMGTVSQYGGIVLVGTLAFTVLTNIDLVIVKHFFPPEQAGYYSAASVLGKIILFVPGTISTLMFPKTSYRFALGQSASDLARACVSVSALMSAAFAAVLMLFPALAVNLLFGTGYEGSIPLVGLYGVTMGLYALVQLLLAYYISQAEARFAWLLVAVAALLAGFLAIVHADLIQVIGALAVSAIVILAVSEVWLHGLGIVPVSGSVPE